MKLITDMQWEVGESSSEKWLYSLWCDCMCLCLSGNFSNSLRVIQSHHLKKNKFRRKLGVSFNIVFSLVECDRVKEYDNICCSSNFLFVLLTMIVY